MENKVVWRPVKGFEGLYETSNTGAVRSFLCKNGGIRKTPKILKEPNGKYKIKTFCKNGKRFTKSLHRVVAKAFLSNPDNYKEVNHKDGNPSNNHVSNLEWVTSSENTVHSYNNGLQKRGEHFYSAKLTENEAIEIINAYKLGVFSQSLISKSYGVSKSSIKDLLSGRNWAHLGIQDVIKIRTDRVVQYQSSGRG
ncbi:MAG: NUMOD4 motif-containing HNH endonuclease [Balneola sp.]